MRAGSATSQVGTPARSEGAARAFEAHAARAEALSTAPAADAEPLRFAAGLLREQARIADLVEGAHAVRRLSGDLASDLGAILQPTSAVFRFAESHGPAPVAEEARSRAREDERTAASRLLVYWSGDRSSAEDYLSRAALRPYVEVLRGLEVVPKRTRPRGRCPFCGGAPGIGRRRGADSQGAVRSLVCALCGLEWEVPRIRCAACSEKGPERLPAFTSASHPLVRIEACETCRRYLKTLDTSLDERIVPEVDDLLSLSMDLWAKEQGFERVEPGLAGA
jgi:FdhE protein